MAVTKSILGQYQFGNGAGGSLTTFSGVAYAVSNSIIEAAGSIPSGICGTAGVLCNVDAKLEGIAENGGTLQTFTHALRSGSPALNAGNNAGVPTFDQRGSPFARIIDGAVDIGAFESPPLAAAPPPCKLDMDGDNQVMATREGLVLIRSMLGFGSAAAVGGTGITQSQWDATRSNLNANCGTTFPP